MTGSGSSLWPLSVEFYLDENLPKQVADALRVVGYPITHPDLHSLRGAKDEILIPWMSENGYVWITKDDAAKKAHAELMRKHGLSVLWIRGVERRKNRINSYDLHRMLTDKLLAAATAVGSARGPVHQMTYLSGDRPALKRVDAMQLSAGRQLKSL